MAAYLPTAEEIRSIIREEVRAALSDALGAPLSPANQPAGQGDFLDTIEAAAVASVCQDTILDWIKRGLPAGKPGGKEWRIRRRDLDLWLSRPKRGKLPSR